MLLVFEFIRFKGHIEERLKKIENEIETGKQMLLQRNAEETIHIAYHIEERFRKIEQEYEKIMTFIQKKKQGN